MTERERGLLKLICSPDGCNSQCLAKAGSREPGIPLWYHIGVLGTQILGPSSVALADTLAGSFDGEVYVIGSGLTIYATDIYAPFLL